MNEYIITCYDDLAMWLEDNVDSMKEIVRCKDCKHHEYLTVSYLDKPFSVCFSEQWTGAEGDNPLVESDGFCSWGERCEK